MNSLVQITAVQAEAIDTIYQRIPMLRCKRLCQESCGPILMSRLEWERICAQLHRIPKGRADLTCPMLKNDQDCRVYAIRPAICRIWGVVKAMSCPHGCEPDTWLSDDEAYAILGELDTVS